MSKPQISCLIRTKDEEKNIVRAIRSVSELADEIIVLDSGSRDKTVELAKKHGAKVYFKEWSGYATQLNYGIELCTKDWIFILDADEEVSEELKKSIIQELKDPKYKVYMINRKNFYLGKFLDHGWYPEWRVRLFKKGTVRFEDEIHEKPIYNEPAGKLKGDLYHYPYQDLYHQFQKTIMYAKESARIKYDKGKRFGLGKLIFNPFWHFIKLFILKKAFLEGKRGLVVSLCGFMYKLLIQLFLLEIELSKKR